MREPTIYQYKRRGKVEYRLRAWQQGKRVLIGCYPTREAAEIGKEAYLARLAKAATPTELTVERWIEDWLDARKAKKKPSEPDSRRLWKAYVVKSKLGAMALRSVRAEHVQDFLDELAKRKATRGKRRGLPIAESTLRNARNLLSASFQAAVPRKLRVNPARGAQIEPQGQTDDVWHYLTLDEIDRVFACPLLDTVRRKNTGVRSALTVAIYAGLREGELWGLRWEDVHEHAADPHVVVRYSYDGPTKNKKIRTVPLLPPAVAALAAWRSHKGTHKIRGLVWPGKGGRMAAHGHDASWPRIRDEAKVRSEVRFHDLRHTCASHLVSGSWGHAWRLEEVRDILGHSDLRTTQRYAHLSPESILGTAAKARATWNPSGNAAKNQPEKQGDNVVQMRLPKP